MNRRGCDPHSQLLSVTCPDLCHCPGACVGQLVSGSSTICLKIKKTEVTRPLPKTNEPLTCAHTSVNFHLSHDSYARAYLGHLKVKNVLPLDMGKAHQIKKTRHTLLNLERKISEWEHERIFPFSLSSTSTHISILFSGKNSGIWSSKQNSYKIDSGHCLKAVIYRLMRSQWVKTLAVQSPKDWRNYIKVERKALLYKVVSNHHACMWQRMATHAHDLSNSNT